MRMFIGFLFFSPLLAVLVWSVYKQKGIKGLLFLLSGLLWVLGYALILTGCAQKHYKGVIMDGNCEYREVPGGTPIVVCPDGRNQ